jgi:hypothetical protein
MSHKSSRRDFIKSSSAMGLGVAWWVGNTSHAFADSKNPLERLNFACIGVGGKGSSDTDHAGAAGNIVALCDVDDNQLNKKAAHFSSAKKFNDYREMFEKIGKEIDAVTVATPDHSHAAASVMAMKLGKHCHTQKPLTWSIYEARRMREIAAEMKVATQMGNQGTSHAGLREAVEVIRSGALGKVTDVHVWTNRPIWPQGEGRPKETQPIPPSVHWDLFLGPAPERPYNACYHPFKWRGWLDFGTGAGDMAATPPTWRSWPQPFRSDFVAETSRSLRTKPAGRVDHHFSNEDGPVKFTCTTAQEVNPELLHGERWPTVARSSSAKRVALFAERLHAEYAVAEDKYADYKPEPTLPRLPCPAGPGSTLCRICSRVAAAAGHVELRLRRTSDRNDSAGQPRPACRQRQQS